MIDIFLLAIVAVVAWCVAAEGAWGAAYTFVAVLIAGLLAMALYEPMAYQLSKTVGIAGWANKWDFISYLVLFGGITIGLRLLSEQLAPTLIETDAIIHDGGRWLLAVATGYLTMAILLTSLHMAPMPRTFFGFEPERDNFLNMSAPDRQWLGFVQYVSEHSLKISSEKPGFDAQRFPAADGSQQIVSNFLLRYNARRQMSGRAARPAAPVITPPTTPTGRGPSSSSGF